MRDYYVISPSLEGVLRHESIDYGGISRPIEVMRVLDGPRSKSLTKKECTDEERKVLEQYFQDLYGVFLKKLSIFALESDYADAESLKLQAMLQEMIKVKKLVGRGGK